MILLLTRNTSLSLRHASPPQLRNLLARHCTKLITRGRSHVCKLWQVLRLRCILWACCKRERALKTWITSACVSSLRWENDQTPEKPESQYTVRWFTDLFCSLSSSPAHMGSHDANNNQPKMAAWHPIIRSSTDSNEEHLRTNKSMKENVLLRRTRCSQS